MENKPTNVLFVEKDPATRRLVQRILSRPQPDSQYVLETAPTLSNAINHLRKKRFDNVLLDLDLPDSEGLDTVKRIHNSNPDVAIIVLTAETDEAIEVEAIRRGADDCLIKGMAVWESLAGHIRYAIHRKKAIEALRHNCDHFKSIVQDAPCPIICISPEGRILEFNAEAQRLWGRRREDVLGKSFLKNCVWRGDRFNLYIDLRNVLSGKSVKSTTITLTLPDGTAHPLSWDFGRTMNDNDQPAAVIAVAHELASHEAPAKHYPSSPKGGPAPSFNETADLVMNSLAAILKKLDHINKTAGAESLKQLTGNLGRSRSEISPAHAAAVERLVLSLITANHEEVS